MESKSVITINEYGRINIRLRELMDSRHITRNYLAKASVILEKKMRLYR